MVESRYDRAFIELENRCRKRSLVVLMTNLFDDLNAQLAGEYLRNLRGRHLPLAVFLRDHDLFALADRRRIAKGSGSSRAPRPRRCSTGASECWRACGKAGC